MTRLVAMLGSQLCIALQGSLSISSAALLHAIPLLLDSCTEYHRMRCNKSGAL